MLKILFGVAICLAYASAAYPDDKHSLTSEEVLDRFVEVTGGVAAYQKIHNRREVMELIVSFERGSTMSTMEFSKPDFVRCRLELPDGTKSTWGFHSGVAWSIDDESAEVIDGEEKNWLWLFSQFDLDYNWREYFVTLSEATTETLDGQNCYRIDIEAKFGLTFSLYFDVVTGLRRAIKLREKSVYGIVQTTRVFDDYRNVDGLLLPHTMVERSRDTKRGFEWTTKGKIKSIEHNFGLPKDYFEPPRSVKVLLDERADRSEGER